MTDRAEFLEEIMWNSAKDGISTTINREEESLKVSIRHLTAFRARAADYAAIVLTLLVSGFFLINAIIYTAMQGPDIKIFSLTWRFLLPFLVMPCVLWGTIVAFRHIASVTTVIELSPDLIAFIHRGKRTYVRLSEKLNTLCISHDRQRVISEQPKAAGRTYYSRTFFVVWYTDGQRFDVAEIFGWRRAEAVREHLEYLAAKLWTLKGQGRRGIGATGRYF